MAPAKVLHPDTNFPHTSSAPKSAANPTTKGPNIKYVKYNPSGRRHTQGAAPLPPSSSSSSHSANGRVATHDSMAWLMAHPSGSASNKAKDNLPNGTQSANGGTKHPPRVSLPSMNNEVRSFLSKSLSAAHEPRPSQTTTNNPSRETHTNTSGTPPVSASGFVLPRGLDPDRRESKTNGVNSASPSQETPRTKRKRNQNELENSVYGNPNKRPSKGKNDSKKDEKLPLFGSIRSNSQSTKASISGTKQFQRTEPIDLTLDDTPPPENRTQSSATLSKTVDASQQVPDKLAQRTKPAHKTSPATRKDPFNSLVSPPSPTSSSGRGTLLHNTLPPLNNAYSDEEGDKESAESSPTRLKKQSSQLSSIPTTAERLESFYVSKSEDGDDGGAKSTHHQRHSSAAAKSPPASNRRKASPSAMLEAAITQIASIESPDTREIALNLTDQWGKIIRDSKRLGVQLPRKLQDIFDNYSRPIYGSTNSDDDPGYVSLEQTAAEFPQPETVAGADIAATQQHHDDMELENGVSDPPKENSALHQSRGKSRSRTPVVPMMADRVDEQSVVEAASETVNEPRAEITDETTLPPVGQPMPEVPAPNPEVEMETENPEQPEAGAFDEPEKTAQRRRDSISPELDSNIVDIVDLSSLSIPDQVDVAMKKCIKDFGAENEYMIRSELKRARLGTQKPTLSTMQGEGSTAKPYDFAGFKPLAMKTAGKFTGNKNSVAFVMEGPGASGIKISKKTYCMAPLHTYEAHDTMPEYAHYVSLQHNVLSRNEKTMRFWPYFGDDFVSTEANLHHHYSMDIKCRPRKIKRLVQAQQYDEFVEGALEDLGITWGDILRFLLEEDPDVGSDAHMLRLKKLRDSLFCFEDFYRPAYRTDEVLSLLPVSPPDKLAKAATLCETFQTRAAFPLWHVARRHMYDTKVVEDIDNLDPDSMAEKMAEKTCRICLRFMCQYHGEYEERWNEGETNCNPDDIPKDVHGDGGDGNDVLATEMVHPPNIDNRLYLTFPPSDEEEHSEMDEPEPVAKKDRDRRTVRYWNGYEHRAEERDQFYPCHHPGRSCEDEQCSCYKAKIPCEKTCSCPNSCTRKWQGCACRKKGRKMLCYEDDTCACFQLGRECDPDLCGPCNACEVLDPVNRYKDMRHGCRNVNLQRGVAKHTLLGDSAIHGFGLYAGEDIGPHEFIGEYVGEVITKNEADRRGTVYILQKLSYLFSLNKSLEIDSTYFGNKTRFVNHASGGASNLYPRIQMVNTVHRIGFYATRAISAGEELFFDYGPQFPDDQLGEPVKGKNKKSAPHVRNANLVRDEFYAVERGEDEHGVSTYRKMTKSRGSALSRQNSSRQRGGARPNAGRKPSRRAPLPVAERPPSQRSRSSVADRLASFHASDLPAPEVQADTPMADEEEEEEEDPFEADEEHDSEVHVDGASSDESGSVVHDNDEDDDGEESETSERRRTRRRWIPRKSDYHRPNANSSVVHDNNEDDGEVDDNDDGSESETSEQDVRLPTRRSRRALVARKSAGPMRNASLRARRARP